MKRELTFKRGDDWQLTWQFKQVTPIDSAEMESPPDPGETDQPTVEETPVNLSGCYARFALQRTGPDRLSTTGDQITHLIISDTPSAPPPGPSDPPADTLAITEATGEVFLHLRPATTARFIPGIYGAEVEITWSDSTVTTTDSLRLDVLPDLAT